MKNNRGEIKNETRKIIDLIKDYSYSIQYISLAFGVLATIFGILIIVFLRTLSPGVYDLDIISYKPLFYYTNLKAFVYH